MAAIERRAAERFREVGLDWVAELPPVPASILEAGRLRDSLWVAERDGAPVGFLLASVLDHELHIDELDVDPAHQRRGIGRALVEHACAVGIARGFPAVTLLTFLDVPWNAPFYARAGFIAIEPSAMGPELRAKVQTDATRLDAGRRVFMRRRLG